ncbi:MAG TPA: hypothetical protein DEQ38_05920 [Elusimicrobia bacterium]|nr:MAG: hypothetical protein A2089_13905 [Elusimicrobia bacterium GWD2_63_28]HCC47638.1 hypothetical protein [Elusimicrobiota bacterium]
MKKLQMGDAEQAAFVRLTKGINLFAAIQDVAVMEQILACVGLYEFEAGEKVFGQGEPGDAFYAVQSGSLKVSVREAFVLSRKLAELKEGDFFGEMALLDSAPRSATVTCVTQAKLFALKRVDFQSAIRENPEFLAQIKRLAADRLFDLKLDR